MLRCCGPCSRGGDTARRRFIAGRAPGRFFHNSVPPPKLNRASKPPEQCDVRPFNQRPKDTQKALESYMQLVLFFLVLYYQAQTARDCAEGSRTPLRETADIAYGCPAHLFHRCGT